MTILPAIPDDLKVWLKAAPLPVVLLICLTTTGAISTWVWAVAGEVREQRAAVAVAAEQGQAAVRSSQNIESRLTRLETKLDRLMEIVAGLAARRADEDAAAAAERRARTRLVEKEKTR